MCCVMLFDMGVVVLCNYVMVFCFVKKLCHGFFKKSRKSYIVGAESVSTVPPLLQVGAGKVFFSIPLYFYIFIYKRDGTVDKRKEYG